MSLDVTLKADLSSRIKEWEENKSRSLKEAGEMKGLIPLIKEYYEDRKPVETEDDYLFSANITHNLGEMADAVGIYKHLWRPEELGIKTAKELIEPIMKGLTDMKARPDHYKKFDAKNGWGTYNDFIPWIEKYLAACIEYPNSLILVSR